jgi:hypothetical protein
MRSGTLVYTLGSCWFTTWPLARWTSRYWPPMSGPLRDPVMHTRSGWNNAFPGRRGDTQRARAAGPLTGALELLAQRLDEGIPFAREVLVGPLGDGPSLVAAVTEEVRQRAAQTGDVN